ncbi:MAG: trehalose-phosphatase [Candidatus Omnitrophica bacterium]|nr:trehalose-phosphatase [Candidatus Omnitrophota bacterium]
MTPIVRRPGAARLAPSVREVLRKLHRPPRTYVAIVSGRTVQDVAARVGIRDLIYSGNHGLECRGPDPRFRFLHPGISKAGPLLSKIARRLRRKLRASPCVWVENKRFSLSVHFRGAGARETERARQILKEVLKDFTGRFDCREGKKVWEVKPRTRWNKGSMTRWLTRRIERLSRKKPIAIYIGDDRTDEDAFRALGKRAWTVKVSPAKNPPTFAQYRLASVRHVHQFLRRLACQDSKSRTQSTKREMSEDFLRKRSV